MNIEKVAVRPSWNEYFLRIAAVISSRSHDEQTKVGAVIVDAHNRILSTGYNGFPAGSDDDALPKTRPDKYPFMIHAELNAIVSTKVDLRESILYCTHSPCLECSKAIVAAGIQCVYFGQHYANGDFEFTRSFLQRSGVQIKKV